MPFWSLSTGGSQDTWTVLELMTLAWRLVGSPGTAKNERKKLELQKSFSICRKKSRGQTKKVEKLKIHFYSGQDRITNLKKCKLCQKTLSLNMRSRERDKKACKYGTFRDFWFFIGFHRSISSVFITNYFFGVAQIYRIYM